jgi:hypothetical protein
MQRIKDAALHAMHIRGHDKYPVPVELHVLPVGIEVEVRSYGRSTKRLIGWETISEARSNVLSAVIDEMVENRNARSE